MVHQNLLRVERGATSNNNITSGNDPFNRSGTTSPALSNPFTATHFEPRIDVKPWLNYEIARGPRTVPIIIDLCHEGESEPDPERPRKKQSGAGRDNPARNVTRSDIFKRQIPEGQSAEVLEPLPLKKKIPWKDKYILVRLPPPPPRKLPDQLPQDKGSKM